MPCHFLIDECLSPGLVRLAHDAGFAATSVRDRGWCGLPDREIIRRAVEHDLTLVTNNAVDFRGSCPPKAGGLYALEDLHAGLVCLNTATGMLHRDLQRATFSVLLQQLPLDMVNRVIEILVQEDGSFSLLEYALPES